jgi:tripartite ATP-independent transporter DctM subunit
MITALMFGGLLLGIFLGYPIAFCMGGIALAVGFTFWGPGVLGTFYARTIGTMSNYVFLAAPLFIFMGIMVERSGVSERVFTTLHTCMGGFRGGLAVATIILGTILAAAVGIIGASVVMLGLVALPAMLKRGYSKELSCGSVCAGGTLGILIPPSVMLVIYGPTANIGVGRLFMAAFIPGLLLASLYIAYIAVRSYLSPSLAPPAPPTERKVSNLIKLRMLATSLLPPLALIVAVLGSIFAGIAAPTEASAVGALAATLLAVAYRAFTWEAFKDTTYQTMRTTCMVMIIAVCASMFTSTFIGLGCGDVVMRLILAIPFGRWGSFAMIMVILLVLGMFIDWIGIIFIMVPIVTPIGEALEFHQLWFAMMIIINLQMSFLTPPFAYALFFLKGICKPEWGVETMHIMKGVVPFVLLVIVGLALCVAFPEIILYLPRAVMKG